MHNLRSFLRTSAERIPGSIKVIDAPVDRRFGLQSVAMKFAERGEHPGLLFNRVDGSRFRAVANLLASYDRIALAMNCEVGELAKIYGTKLGNLLPTVTVAASAAPVKGVVLGAEEIDLGGLPIPWHNELDAGPYITGGMTILRDPETGKQNAGIYRHQIYGARELAMWFTGTHHAAQIFRYHEERNERTPVALAIGHHPALLLAAVARMSGPGGEFEAAGAFLGEPVELVRAETSDLLVPAQAEFIIEGYIEPGRRLPEGPFGEWPGHYMGNSTAPIMIVTAITHRPDAIYQDVISAAREHLLLGGLPRNGSIYRAVKDVVPNVVAVNVPAETRMHCYISLKRRRNVDVKRAAFVALATEPENLRAVIVVDDDINVFDHGDVLWAVGTRFDAARDLTILQDWNGPSGSLPSNWQYHADGTRTPRAAAAMILDATKPPPPIPYPDRCKVPDASLAAIDLALATDLSAASTALA
jgi:2,5-furandicarboxylate decarboxylase 1